MRSSSSKIALLLAILSAACASGASNTRVAPNNQSLTLEYQDGLGLSKARITFLRNGSSVPVTVSQITVTSCVNLKQYCGVNKTNILVQPGQRREILRIEPLDEGKAFNYRMQWRWSAAANVRMANNAPAAPVDSATAARRQTALELAELFRSEDAKYGDKILYSNTLSALGDNFASMRAEPDTMQIAVGSRLYIYEQLRILALDKQGKVLGRVRGSMQWSVTRSPAIRFLSPDTLVADSAGSTTVTMRLQPNTLLDTLRARTMAPVVFTIIAK